MKKHFFWMITILTSLFLMQSCATVDSHRHSGRKTGANTHKSAAAVKTGAYKSNVEATYYHDKFNGKKTASGVVFSNQKLTAAHRSLPFGTKIKVTNPVNGASVVVTVTDRGPFTKGRELDLSKKAFMAITDDKNKGTIRVNIDVVE